MTRDVHEFCLQVVSFHTFGVLYHAIKSYGVEQTALLPIRRKSCCGFLTPLKIIILDRF
jgi:hypothetical protein